MPCLGRRQYETRPPRQPAACCHIVISTVTSAASGMEKSKSDTLRLSIRFLDSACGSTRNDSVVAPGCPASSPASTRTAEYRAAKQPPQTPHGRNAAVPCLFPRQHEPRRQPCRQATANRPPGRKPGCAGSLKKRGDSLNRVIKCFVSGPKRSTFVTVESADAP